MRPCAMRTRNRIDARKLFPVSWGEEHGPPFAREVGTTPATPCVLIISWEGGREGVVPGAQPIARRDPTSRVGHRVRHRDQSRHVAESGVVGHHHLSAVQYGHLHVHAGLLLEL